ncbi:MULTISPECIES: DNA double-strand break repair nuclease NurA [Haloferax]|uniref:Nuclease n=1 Tax=Haloferax marinum TaxID=2666143 RepID=A0A6A8GB68_9EURY|nr:MULTISPECIES: DNA double-strand break repair nuclease NurA [Haloferax]KAB1198382.1 DNA double-strand break repair nuclease NurA [Haloferax sp. CBA1150]MRW97483.1 nuclease [Haloferax marinum]
MTLDPVHVDDIASMASSIADSVDDTDYEDIARTVWESWLDPLSPPGGGRPIIEPLGEQRLNAADVDDIALTDTPFPTVHGLDSGTINPTTFKNGLVLDVAHAAMAAEPSDLDLHRARSIVMTAHTRDSFSVFDTGEWLKSDQGYVRKRILRAPRVNRYAEGVVHALSLYLAESEHALYHADRVSDLLILDGPVYPKELLNWRDRDAELKDLAREAKPKAIVENYVRLVERFVERDVPLAGFVKNPGAKHIVRTLQQHFREDGSGDIPWVDDASFFVNLLERRDGPEREDRRTEALTFTNWFVSRGGSDRQMSADGDAFGIDRSLDPESYTVTFFVLYDPRTDVCYRVEAPYAFTKDPETRENLMHHVVRDVAATRGPPLAVEKADELARVSVGEKAALRRKLSDRLSSDPMKSYDNVRWADADE